MRRLSIIAVAGVALLAGLQRQQELGSEERRH